MTNPVAALREGLADRYAFERELGRGGMATVWLARDLRHDRPVALKMLHASSPLLSPPALPARASPPASSTPTSSRCSTAGR